MEEEQLEKLSEEVYQELLRIACTINTLADKYKTSPKKIAEAIIGGLYSAKYTEGKNE